MIHSDIHLAQKLERTEGRGNAAVVEARRALTPESGACWIQVGGAYAMFDGPGSPLTQTFGLGLFEPPAAEHFDEIEDFLKSRSAPVLHEVSPLADASLLSLLGERGYLPVELSSVLYCPLGGAAEGVSRAEVNPQIAVRVIEKGEEEIWARTSAGGWAAEMEGLADLIFDLGRVSARAAGGFPFLAEIEGEPVAAGMLFIYDDVALLGGASTVPESRRQGAQTALLDARLQYAAEAGCTLAMMGAAPGSQSQRNAEKNHFRIAYTRTKWQLVRD